MKKYINIFILFAMLAIIVILLAKNEKESINRIYHYDKEKVILVGSKTIEHNSVEMSSQFTGIFEAAQEGKINAEIQGKILKYYVQEGDRVKKGQVLVKIDDNLLQLQLQAIDVQIEGLEADEKRYSVLSEADAIQGIKLEKIQIGLKSAQIQRKTILEKINKSTVKAPFSGIITMKMSEIGSFAAPGVPLLLLSDLSELKFIMSVSERNVSLMKLNKKYTIIADAYPSLKIDARLTNVGSKGNMGNSFPIEFTFDNRDHKIKSKMFGKVTIEGDLEAKGITIPASSIVGSDIDPKVYIIKNGKAHLQNVIISSRYKSNIIIESGLKEGDIIVTSGFINLFDGANVKSKK